MVDERWAIPVIIDVDTGFGNVLNTIRTGHEFESAGAATLQLEDQSLQCASRD